MTLFSDFAKALAQLGDPKFLKILLKAVGLSAALFGGAYFGLLWLATTILPGSISLPWLGSIPIGDWFGGIALTGALFMAVFLMFPVAMVFLGFFLEEIADAVEARYYPDLPPVEPLSVGVIVGETLRFLMVMIMVNFFALIIYFASSLLAPVIFYIVNGFLLGREYFQLVAMRRLGMRGAAKLRKAHRWEIWLAGIFMAVPLSVPVLNLFVPLLGVATFTHQFHRLRKKQTG
ncbi:MAG: EI24 domain-containing protein [Rhodobacteraceae bacterium]|nr:EI24 domain-containing protein [Paracoccaceae bacterium]